MKSLFNQNFKYLVDKCAPPLETIAIRTGIDKVDLSDYYNDYNEPDLESALILAHFFKVPIETFLLANMQAKGSRL